MDETLARLKDFAENKKDVSDYIVNTFVLINLANKQGITLPDAYFEGIIVTTELILNQNVECHGK